MVNRRSYDKYMLVDLGNENINRNFWIECDQIYWMYFIFIVQIFILINIYTTIYTNIVYARIL